MLGIIDYKVINLGSIRNLLKKIGADPYKIVESPHDLKDVTKLILPGVGSFDAGVMHLKKQDLWNPLQEIISLKKIPILGVCLGMQLLTKGSEEGNAEGLGLVDAVTKRFVPGPNFRVPHMGWNYVKFKKKSLLTKDLPEKTRFYFVHSYYVECRDASDVLMETEYAGEDFCSSFSRENITAVQFHPEKSHRFGQTVFRNFSLG